MRSYLAVLRRMHMQARLFPQCHQDRFARRHRSPAEWRCRRLRKTHRCYLRRMEARDQPRKRLRPVNRRGRMAFVAHPLDRIRHLRPWPHRVCRKIRRPARRCSPRAPRCLHLPNFARRLDESEPAAIPPRPPAGEGHIQKRERLLAGASAASPLSSCPNPRPATPRATPGRLVRGMGRRASASARLWPRFLSVPKPKIRPDVQLRSRFHAPRDLADHAPVIGLREAAKGEPFAVTPGGEIPARKDG